MQVVSPNYVRKVFMKNSTTMKLYFQVQYGQNHAVFAVDPQGHADIEGEIDHGSYQTVDPIKKITVSDSEQGGNTISTRDYTQTGVLGFADVQGVKIFDVEVDISSEGDLRWFEQPHHD